MGVDGLRVRRVRERAREGMGGREERVRERVT